MGARIARACGIVRGLRKRRSSSMSVVECVSVEPVLMREGSYQRLKKKLLFGHPMGKGYDRARQVGGRDMTVHVL